MEEPEPYLVSEFGEIVEFRPGGCPECDATEITVSADSCHRCGAQFTPWEQTNPPRR